MTEYIKTCPKCDSPIKRVPAGVSRKTGKPYDAFMACEDRNCDYTARVEYEKPIPKKANGDALIMDELQKGFKELNDRLDSLAQFLSKHLK